MFVVGKDLVSTEKRNTLTLFNCLGLVSIAMSLIVPTTHIAIAGDKWKRS